MHTPTTPLRTAALLGLLLAIFSTLTAAAPAAAEEPAADDSRTGDQYLEPVSITFPVNGPNHYTDTYDDCRSSCDRPHKATDMMADYGIPVHAARGGTIRHLTGLNEEVPSYGYMISIEGDDGRQYNYIHLGTQDGGHLDAYAPNIDRGVQVERGQLIGYVGDSGNATGTPHLHFEIEDPNIVDPYGTNNINPYQSLQAAEAAGRMPTDQPTVYDQFDDVEPSDIHADNIIALADADITKGCGNLNFCPNNPVTRGQMAAFLTRALNLPASDQTFADTDGHLFEQPTGALAQADITRGCNPPDNTHFCPDQPVTRGQMAAFLDRALGLPTSDRTFADTDGHLFEDSIGALAAAGITRGCNPPDNTRFCPDQPVTRAQMATFLTRALALPKPGDPQPTNTNDTGSQLRD